MNVDPYGSQIDLHRMSPKESFIGFLDMMRVFSDLWEDLKAVMEIIFLDRPKPTEYLFETLWQAWTELSDDPEELFRSLLECDSYRVFEDPNYFDGYKVSKDQLDEVRNHWFVEFYVLPEKGADWVLVCTDGYQHFPSCIIRKRGREKCIDAIKLG